jgi:hypothetical protein
MTLIAVIGVRNGRWECILYHRAPLVSDAEYLDDANGAERL